MPNNLSLEEAIEALQAESINLETPILDGIDPATIYSLGFATAVKHLQEITGPGQMEVSVITVDVTQEMLDAWEADHPGMAYPLDDKTREYFEAVESTNE